MEKKLLKRIQELLTGSLPEEKSHFIINSLISFLNKEVNWIINFSECCFIASVLVQKVNGEYLKFYYQAYWKTKILKQKHELLWNTIYTAFSKRCDIQNELFSMYFDFVNEWKKIIKTPDAPGDRENKGNKCIILTSQLLTPPHAPTIKVLDMYTALTDLNFDPVIVNTADLPRENGLPLLDSFVANKIEKLSGLQSVSYGNDRCYNVYTTVEKMPSTEGIYNTLSFINSLNPCFILVYGGFGILSDLVAEHHKVIIVTSTTEIAPTQLAYSMVVWRDLTDKDRALIERFGMNRVKIISLRSGVSLDQINEGVKIDRKEIGLSSDDFLVAIVGNRLDSEITNDFLEFLTVLKGKKSNIKYLIIGNINQNTSTLLTAHLGDTSCKFLGYVQQLVEVYKLCDVYVNPPRQGGGYSAVMALYAGLPAYSLDEGDVSIYLEDNYKAACFNELIEKISNEFDTDYHIKSKKACVQRYGSFSSEKQNMKYVLENSGVDV